MKDIVKQIRKYNSRPFPTNYPNSLQDIVRDNSSNQFFQNRSRKKILGKFPKSVLKLRDKSNKITVEKFATIIKRRAGNVTPEFLQKMISNLEILPESLIFVPKAGEDEYSYQSFIKTPDFEIIFCRWDVGQSSDLHSHKKSLAGIKILKGKLTSHKCGWGVSNNRNVITHGIESKTLKTGDVSIVKVDEAHLLMCEEPTISLHVYIKPLIQICVYDPFSGKSSDRIFRCRL